MGHGDEKKMSPQKNYSQLTRASIANFAGAVYDKNLSENVKGTLSENMSYIMREQIKLASQYTKHACRPTLTADDLNKAVQASSSPPVYGYTNPRPFSYAYFKEFNIYTIEEKEIDLLGMPDSIKIYDTCPEPSVNLMWGTIEGAACPPCHFTESDLSNMQISPSKSSTTQGSEESVPYYEGSSTCQFAESDFTKVGTSVVKKPTMIVSGELIAYYDAVTKAILSNDEPAIKLALADLQRNVRISPLLPNLVNFVSVGVENLDLSEKNKLLRTMQSIVVNPGFFIGHEPYLTSLVQSVLHCITEPLSSPMSAPNDHWVLRDSAAQLLVRIHVDWASSVNKLYYKTLNHLQSIFTNLKKPFCSHYGAVIGIRAFGVKAVEEFLYPHLKMYMIYLNKTLDRIFSVANAKEKADAQKVHNVLLDVCLQIIQFYVGKIFVDTPVEANNVEALTDEHGCVIDEGATNIEISEGNEEEDRSNDANAIPAEHAFVMYKTFYQYFGDSFINLLPWIDPKQIYVPAKRELVKLFNCPEFGQSGEELLEKFYEKHNVDDQVSDYGDSCDAFETTAGEKYHQTTSGENEAKYDQVESNDEQDNVSPPFHSDEEDSGEFFRDKQNSRKRKFSRRIDFDDDSGDDASPDSDEYKSVSRDLQIKSTVTDKGIKLIIAKKHKSKPPDKPPKAKKQKAGPVLSLSSTERIFDNKSHPPIRHQEIRINFAGATPLPLNQLKRWTPIIRSSENSVTRSVCTKWKTQLPVTGKRSFDPKKWFYRKIQPVNLANML